MKGRKLSAALWSLVFASLVPAAAQAPGAKLQALMKSNFATRQAQLRFEILSSAASGLIGAGAASALQAQLDRINAQEQAALLHGGISNLEANRLIDMLSEVTARLHAENRCAFYRESYLADPFSNPYGRAYPYPEAGGCHLLY